MQTADSSHMRMLNLNLILKMLWKEQSISRAEIARRTGLARSTVSEIVAQLLEYGLILETGAVKSGIGRRPIQMEFNNDAYGSVGVDMGGTHIGVVVINMAGEVKAWEQIPHPVRSDPVGTLGRMMTLTDKCIWASGFTNEQLVGVGIAVPSPVDPADPENCLSSLILPHWRGHNLYGIFANAYKVPIYVDNDANLGALAEHWWGAGKDFDDIVYIKVGSGIGAGFLFKGEVYRGARGMAGVIDHMVVDAAVSQSPLGRKGGLVTLVGSEAIVDRAVRQRDQHPDTALGKGGLTVKDIVDAALGGDRLAKEIIGDVGKYLGIAVANLLHLFNPSVVALGGAIAAAGDLLVECMRDTIKERTLWESFSDSLVVVSALGEKCIAMGAATQVLQAALNDLSLFPVRKVQKEGRSGARYRGR